MRLLFAFRMKPHKPPSVWEQLLGWLVCEATLLHGAEKVQSAHNHRAPHWHVDVHTAAQGQRERKTEQILFSSSAQ